MKQKIPSLQLVAGILLILFLASCNTYKWQRKRYYQTSKAKNWNNYNSKKTKLNEEKSQ